jgi:CHAD domain-containing protein
MAFGLRTKESISAGLTRSVQSELKRALREVNELNAEGTVHAIRKRIKRIRALVRLVEDDIGEKPFAKIDARLQESGSISPTFATQTS